MQCAELQAHITAVRAERGFTTEPLHILAHLVEEVGEVASELKKTWAGRSYGEFEPARLAGELADVNVLLHALAETFQIDLEAATLAKVGADGARDWPSAPSEAP